MADTRKDVLKKQFDDEATRDKEIASFTSNIMKDIDKLNKKYKNNAQVYTTRDDEVYLHNEDGTVQDKPAVYDKKSKMYVSPNAPVKPPAR
jgi:hypothetical protein